MTERVKLTEAGRCPACDHYRNHGSSGGTPPWPTCRFDARPETCGRFQPSPPRATWESAIARQALKDPQHD